MKEGWNIRLLYRIGLYIMILLGLWSWLWYRERMTFLDPALITFTIIKTKALAIMEHRYGSFITQIVPFMGQKFGWSLPSILRFYSVSFYLFYFLVYLISGKYLKQKWLSILLLLYLTLLVSDTYFWPNNEVHQGIAWSILGLSFWWSPYSKFKYISLPFLALGISCHNLVGIPILFIALGFAYFNDYKKELILISAILIFIAIRYLLSHNSWYDGVKLYGIKNITVKDIQVWQSAHLASALPFLKTKFSIFYLIILACLWSLRKNLLWLMFTIGTCCLYILLITLVFKEKITADNLFYFESEWMPITLIICFSIVFKGLQNSSIYLYLLVAGLILSIGRIHQSSLRFKSRFSTLESNVKQLYQEKIYKSIYLNASDDQYINTYNLALESATISAILGHRPIVTFKKGDSTSITSDRHIFKSSYQDEYIDSLNYEYYPFDTMGYYQIKKGS